MGVIADDVTTSVYMLSPIVVLGPLILRQGENSRQIAYICFIGTYITLPGFVMAKIMSSLAEKRQYFDRVKLENYRESMRLEGLKSGNQTLPASKHERDKLKQRLLSKYAAKTPQN